MIGMRQGSKVSQIKVGDPFGMLTVATLPEMREHLGKDYWMCWCDCSCGRRVELMASNLIRNNSKSCGCRKGVISGDRKRTHALSGTRIHHIWGSMIRRCRHADNPKYKRHGGRGIKVCLQWQESFEAFFDWAMANGYNHGLTIERKDNDGDYCPENCTWATWFEQAANKCNNNVFAAFGETKHLAAWARDPRCRVDIHCLGQRIRRGIDPEKAMTDPVKTWKKRAAKAS